MRIETKKLTVNGKEIHCVRAGGAVIEASGPVQADQIVAVMKVCFAAGRAAQQQDIRRSLGIEIEDCT